MSPESRVPSPGILRQELRVDTRERGVVGAVGLLLAVALVACSSDAPIPTGEELLAAISVLEVPRHWEQVSEKIVERPCTNVMETCPLVERIYQVEADPTFAQDAAQMLVGAGLQTDRTCEAPERGCHVWGYRGNVIINVLVSEADGNTLTVTVGAAEFTP